MGVKIIEKAEILSAALMHYLDIAHVMSELYIENGK
jgi:hypothetical protein